MCHMLRASQGGACLAEEKPAPSERPAEERERSAEEERPMGVDDLEASKPSGVAGTAEEGVHASPCAPWRVLRYPFGVCPGPALPEGPWWDPLEWAGSSGFRRRPEAFPTARVLWTPPFTPRRWSWRCFTERW
jgi:hypothetical protein